MNGKEHDRIEAIAGAIALREASDDERREYREHIAACSQCLDAFGGECEIERVASSVGHARESEIWQPELGDVLGWRMQRRNRVLRYSFGLAGLALVTLVGAHMLIAGSGAPAPATHTVALNTQPVRAASQQKPAVPLFKAIVQPPQRRMIVQHNVVQIARAPLPIQAPAQQVAAPNVKPQEIANVTVHAPPAQTVHKPAQSDVPIWRRDATDAWRTVATTTTTSTSESAPQTVTHHAELIQVYSQHVMRDAAPVGGETAINPQPAMIAYDEGAQGTAVFEVLIDERGNPTRCVITKSAGYPVLDTAVCKAAMQARYTPKTIDGRPVAGVYHDAFTFRMSTDDQTVEGLPTPMPLTPRTPPPQQPIE